MADCAKFRPLVHGSQVATCAKFTPLVYCSQCDICDICAGLPSSQFAGSHAPSSPTFTYAIYGRAAFIQACRSPAPDYPKRSTKGRQVATAASL